MKYNQDNINRIINFKGNNGALIDVFDLHGVLFIGNAEGKEWDITKAYTMYSEHSLGVSIDDFADCTTEDEVKDTFSELLSYIVKQRLL